MEKRYARTQTEIDLLPPFGEPEVVTTGSHAKDMAVLGLATVGAIAYSRSKSE